MTETLTDRAITAQATASPWFEVFLAELLKTEGDIDAAASVANVTVPEVHRLTETNSAARVAFDRTLKTVRVMRAQKLEAVAFHEAAFPPRKYRFTPAGAPIRHPETNEAYFEEDRDNRLVLGLLKALDRENYGEQHIVSGPGGGPIQHTHLAATLADIVRISALMDKGDIAPDEIVGEIVDAEVVDET